ncbi:MAG: ABC transporter substrate-binding protein [Proteobacteria bacterium]|nr:ABC transporter substrate-binding protein [Pseudomonadota bacterium]
MKKALFIVLVSFFLVGCEKKTDESVDGRESVSSKTKVAVSQTDSSPAKRDPEWDPIANPKAVKGGTLNLWGGPFPKSLNYWLDQWHLSSEISELLFEPLIDLHSTKNEPVGCLSDRWEISKDKRTFTFHISPKARWSDGKPITAEDIQFHYDVIMNPKNLTSVFRVSFKRFERPEVIDDKTIRIRAIDDHWKNFWIAGSLMAFPKHVWQDKNFNKQKFKFPVVSGPYRIEEVKKNRFVILSRRGDWWARNEKYFKFKYNFDRIKYKFIEDRYKGLEVFKKGEIDIYPIYTSLIWAKQTNFEQIRKNWIVRQRVYNQEPKGFQGYTVNLRKPMFQDVRVRKALCHLFNRELMNQKLMFNQYFLLNSYYPDLYDDNRNPGAPSLEYDPERARKLLSEAGWKVDEEGFLKKNGQRLQLTILQDSSDIRHVSIYLEDLRKVGIDARIAKLDRATITKRMDNHDFDMYSRAWSASRLRDPESMWHSSTSDKIASQNNSGVADELIDSLIERQKTETSLTKRNDILRQIDQRLYEIVPYVLAWQNASHRVLYWNKFGTPVFLFDKFNREDAVIPYWWENSARATDLARAKKAGTSLPPYPKEVHYTE